MVDGFSAFISILMVIAFICLLVSLVFLGFSFLDCHHVDQHGIFCGECGEQLLFPCPSCSTYSSGSYCCDCGVALIQP